jgi:hypothetical protein
MIQKFVIFYIHKIFIFPFFAPFQIMIREQCSVWLQFFKIYFTDKHIKILMNDHWTFEDQKKYIHCCWVVCFVYVILFVLVDYVAQLCWFISYSPITCWKGNVEVSNYSCEFVYFSFHLLLLHSLWVSSICTLRLLWLWGGLILLSVCCLLLQMLLEQMTSHQIFISSNFMQMQSGGTSILYLLSGSGIKGSV